MVCQHCGRDWKTGVSQNEDRELDKITTPDNISTSRPRRPSGQMVAVAYLAVVAAFLLVGFGSSNVMLDRIFAPLVIYLTLPFSMLSTLFVWSAIHGGSQGPMVVVIAMSAVANAFIISWGLDRIRRSDDVRRRSRERARESVVAQGSTLQEATKVPDLKNGAPESTKETMKTE